MSLLADPCDMVYPDVMSTAEPRERIPMTREEREAAFAEIRALQERFEKEGHLKEGPTWLQLALYSVVLGVLSLIVAPLAITSRHDWITAALGVAVGFATHSLWQLIGFVYRRR
ncbi:MAG TPA: hypothetical protein VG406_07520, partial [Isosphaeraceae bacterium]|nr:hypothetical protein [Isosphaeraceae bacterium]